MKAVFQGPSRMPKPLESREFEVDSEFWTARAFCREWMACRVFTSLLFSPRRSKASVRSLSPARERLPPARDGLKRPCLGHPELITVKWLMRAAADDQRKAGRGGSGERGSSMRRCDYRVLRSGRATVCAVGKLPEADLRRLLEAPDDILWRHIDCPVKIDHGVVIVKAALRLGTKTTPVAYKRYRPRSWWKAVLWYLRPRRAARAWRLGRALASRGIATARPLAIHLSPRLVLRPASYLATEWIESASNLHLYGWHLAGLPSQHRVRCAARCAESLGRLVGRMHAERISHRDLTGANLVVVQDYRADRPDGTRTYLVDLDGVRLRRRLSAARRAANLGRLAVGLDAHPWVTRTVCCRFLRAYINQLPRGTIALKPLWRNVDSQRRRIADRMRRRGERLL